jgi:hypothetical protein
MIQTNLQAQFAEDAVAGANGNYGYGVTVDDDGNSYIIGRFAGTADFDPGSGTFELTANGSSDIYFAKYDVDGNLQWAKQIGKTSYAYGYGIALDGSGGLYITGYFKGTDVDFDPGAGTHNLSSAGNYDVFFAKYSAVDGSYVWAKNIGGADADNAYCVEVVGGYVYIVGRFQGDSDFDPDAGTVTLSSGSTSYYDVFFAKYNATDGSYVWAKDIGKTDRTEYAVDLAVDSDGNMHIVGWFYDTVDFDPDAGTVNLTSNGSRDVFFAKYKSADGSIIWAKNVGGSGGDDDYGYSIDVDANGNVYITGRFEGTGDYDPGAGTANISSNGDYDALLAAADVEAIEVIPEEFQRQLGHTNVDRLLFRLRSDTALERSFDNTWISTSTGFDQPTDFGVNRVPRLPTGYQNQSTSVKCKCPPLRNPWGFSVNGG